MPHAKENGAMVNGEKQPLKTLSVSYTCSFYHPITSLSPYRYPNVISQDYVEDLIPLLMFSSISNLTQSSLTRSRPSNPTPTARNPSLSPITPTTASLPPSSPTPNAHILSSSRTSQKLMISPTRAWTRSTRNFPLSKRIARRFMAQSWISPLCR